MRILLVSIQAAGFSFQTLVLKGVFFQEFGYAIPIKNHQLIIGSNQPLVLIYLIPILIIFQQYIFSTKALISAHPKTPLFLLFF